MDEAPKTEQPVTAPSAGGKDVEEGKAILKSSGLAVIPAALGLPWTFVVRDLLTGGEWGWNTNNTVVGAAGLWQNPGGGFSTGKGTTGKPSSGPVVGYDRGPTRRVDLPHPAVVPSTSPRPSPTSSPTSS